MSNRPRAWLLSAAVLAFVVGLILVISGSAAGWFFFILTPVYLGASTRAGQTWATSNFRLVRWSLIGVTLLLVILAFVVGALVLLK